jgi:hypothetical protein
MEYYLSFLVMMEISQMVMAAHLHAKSNQDTTAQMAVPILRVCAVTVRPWL